MNNARVIKVYPDIGDIYYVILPESIQTEDQVNDWLDDHALNVSNWEFCATSKAI